MQYRLSIGSDFGLGPPSHQSIVQAGFVLPYRYGRGSRGAERGETGDRIRVVELGRLE